MLEIIDKLVEALSFVAILAIPVLFALRNLQQFEENIHRGTDEAKAKAANKKWHTYQFLLQIMIYSLVGQAFGPFVAFAGACLFWLVFDSIVGYGLTGDLMYLGESATLDKLGKLLPQRAVYIIKILLVLASVTLAVIF